MKTKWTADQDDTVRAMWGKQSCVYIGAHLGVSKCAVIGRAHRLGLPSLWKRGEPKPKIVREKRVRRKPQRTQAVYRPADIPAAPIGPVAPLNIPFFDLGPKHCRFPVSGEGYQMLSCGHTPLEGTSYCAWHNSVAHTVLSGPRPNLKFMWRKMKPKANVLLILAAA